jgi:hypothetical protein
MALLSRPGVFEEMLMGSPARCPLARIAFIDRAIRNGGKWTLSL